MIKEDRGVSKEAVREGMEGSDREEKGEEVRRGRENG